MKILSLNIHGFGDDMGPKGKYSRFRNIRSREQPDIVLLQETKCNEVNNSFIEFFWGKTDFEYVQKQKIGKSGGLLIIWDPNSFIVNQAIVKDYLLAIKGHWIGKDRETIVVNVYGPHNDEKKKMMWDCLENIMSYPNAAWVIGGDFNEVHNEEERQNCVFHDRRAAFFNDFIERTQLIEVPLIGKRFTRISDDGSKFSKLDRYLVSDLFLQLWEDISVVALERNLSDHCPIVLRNKNENFVPKPFKLFDVWLESEDVEPIINKYGVFDEELEAARTIALEWEKKADERILSDDERITWLEARNNWLKKDREKAKMLQQKARLKWASEGDDNTKFFHTSIIRRDDLKKAVDWFWENEEISLGCNASFLTLIPKVKCPTGLGDYRPISQIGSLYKIFAKLLANRLKKVISKLVGCEQSTFIEGRYIVDSILSANEVVEDLKVQKVRSLIFKVVSQKRSIA
ncbi:uncharacterized protein [Rutidosis leptorrhynchoides]|uniref:uncharacterized protein n=1 Tax=Rutidosis leptorrhynchoides TaxID=125765 RepID=UPI003A9A4665